MLGQIIHGKYRILDQISEDLLTTAYLAGDQARSELVVLKVIRPEMATSDEFLERFRPQAEKLKRLTAPQVVRPLDSGDTEAGAYVAFEHAESKPLGELIRAEAPLSTEQALDIVYQVALCLMNAHPHDLVHGDLRPANILITDEGTVKVMDFGLAQGVDLSRLLAESKVERGVYHAPELVAGEDVDGRADLYSLGAILFEMLTGEPPTMADELSDADRRPGRLRSEVPPEVDDLVARCLAQDPNDRPQSADEFLEGLDEAVQGMATRAGTGIIGLEDALAGHTLGPYRLIEKLGRGGMATVYKGYESTLDRYVAIKVLPQQFAHDPEFLTRFRREAKAIARLNHPNIVPVYSFGEEGDLTYIVMRYVEGGTLKQRLGRPMPLKQAAKITSQIARALSYAHEQGVIHRDVKPANVLMAEDDWPLLSDFGLARMMGSSVQLTQTGVGIGTPAYMSPEQGQGLKVDGRSDIYSLGIMFYEMLTGQVPYQADTPLAVVLKHITAPLPTPRQVNPDIPEPIERVILKATAKDPEHRYQTAGEMVEALEKALAGLPVEAPTQDLSAPAPGWAAAETAAPSEAAPPRVTLPASALKKVTRWLLSTVGMLVGVLLVVAIVLILGGSFALSGVIEKAVANASWGEAYPGAQVTFTEEEIEHSVDQTVHLYLPGSVENVNLDFVPPDRVDVQGTVFGKDLSVECTLTEANGLIDFEIKRLGDTRLFVVGNILSGGVNRGLKTVLEKQNLTVEKLLIEESSLTIKYAE